MENCLPKCDNETGAIDTEQLTSGLLKKQEVVYIKLMKSV